MWSIVFLTGFNLKKIASLCLSLYLQQTSTNLQHPSTPSFFHTFRWALVVEDPLLGANFERRVHLAAIASRRSARSPRSHGASPDTETASPWFPKLWDARSPSLVDVRRLEMKWWLVILILIFNHIYWHLNRPKILYMKNMMLTDKQVRIMNITRVQKSPHIWYQSDLMFEGLLLWSHGDLCLLL